MPWEEARNSPLESEGAANRARSGRQRDCTGGCDCPRLTQVFELGKKKGTKWGGSRFDHDLWCRDELRL